MSCLAAVTQVQQTCISTTPVEKCIASQQVNKERNHVMIAVKRPKNILQLMACAFGAALTVASLVEPLSASAALKRTTPPSTPGNFHVTGTTTGSVSFAWTASKAGSDRSFVYEIERGDGYILNFGTVTSGTWDVGLVGGETYSFFIFAIDSDNKASADSPTVTVTLPAPPPPPAPVQPDAPVITQVSATTDTITVSWTEATPADEIGGYAVVVNGTDALIYQNAEPDSATEWTLLYLLPETTYTITVMAHSQGGTLQASSAPIEVTTATPPNTTPPTAPTDLTGGGDGGGEAIVSWNPSTSVNTPQSEILYEIYVGGVPEYDVFTIGQTMDQYVFPNGAGDTIYVVAVDQYGNVSAPSNILTVDPADF